MLFEHPLTVITDLTRNPEGQGHRTAIIPCTFHRHSRVGGKPQGGRGRHTGFKAVSTGWDVTRGRQQAQSNHQSPSPLMGEESKVRVTTSLRT